MSGAYLGQMIVQILGQTSQFDESINKSEKVFSGFHDSIIKDIGSIANSTKGLNEQAAVLYKSLENTQKYLAEAENKMQRLISEGISPMSLEYKGAANNVDLYTKQVELAKRQIDEIGKSYKDTSNPMNEFIGETEKQVHAITQLRSQHSELKKQIQDLIIEYANSDKVINEVINVYNEATKSVNDMKDKIADSKSEIASYRKTWEDLGESFGKGELLARDLQRQSIELRNAIATTSKQVNGYEKALYDLTNAQEAAKENIAATKEKYAAMVPTIDELKAKYKDLTEDIKRLESLSKDYDNTLQGLNNHIKDNKDRILELLSSGVSPYNEEIMKLKVQNDKLAGKVAYLKENSKSLNEMLNELAKTSAKFGAVLSASVTAPLVAAGKAAVESAEKLEVSSKKYEDLFSEMMPAATKALYDMQAAYGLTSKQATTFLADASNAFVAMGATRERALEMAQSVVQLTAAISAYSGKPMVDVSKALDLALLGNTRNLRNYGLAIRQSAVNDELAAQGKDKLTGSALQLATSEVALKLILEAAQVPLKTFAENSTSAAFQSQQLKANIDQLASSLGTAMMPTIKTIIGDLTKFVKSLDDISDSTKTGVVVFGAFLALLGPIELGIAALTKGIVALQAAMAAGKLASWTTLIPLVTAAVVGLTGAIVAFKKSADVREQEAQWENLSVKLEKNRDKADSLAEEYQKLYEKTNRTAAETKRMSEIVDELQRLYPDLTEEMIESGAANQALIDEYNTLKDKTNLTANEQDRLSKVTDALNKLYPDFTKSTKDLSDANNTLKDSINGVAKATDEQAKANTLASLSKEINYYAESIVALENEIDRATKGRTEKEIKQNPYIEGWRNSLEKLKKDQAEVIAQYNSIVLGGKKPPITLPPSKELPPPTQGQRLKDLDTERDAMIELAKSTGQDVAAVEKEYYNKRLNLLYSFLDEDVKANKFTWATIGEDLDTTLAVFGTTIRQEISKTVANIDKADIKTSIDEITKALNNNLEAAQKNFEITNGSADAENEANIARKKAYDSAIDSLITLLVTNDKLDKTQRESIENWINSYKKQSNALGDIINRYVNIDSLLKNLENQINLFNEDTNKSMEDLYEGNTAIYKSIGVTINKIKSYKATYGDANGSIQKTIDDLIVKQKEYGLLLQEQGESAAYTEYQKQLANINDQVKKNTIDESEAYELRIDAAKDYVKALQNIIDKYGDQDHRLSDLIITTNRVITSRSDLVKIDEDVKKVTDNYDESIRKLNEDYNKGNIIEEDANKNRLEAMRKAREELIKYKDVSSEARDADIRMAKEEQELLEKMVNNTLAAVNKLDKETGDILKQFVDISVKEHGGYTRVLLNSMTDAYASMKKFSEDSSKTASKNADAVIAISIKLAEEAANTLDDTVRRKMLELSDSLMSKLHVDAKEVQTIVDEQVAKFNIESILEKMKKIDESAFNSANEYINNFINTGGKYGAVLQKEMQSRFNDINKAASDNTKAILAISEKLTNEAVGTLDDTVRHKMLNLASDILNMLDEDADKVQIMVNEQVAKFNIDVILEKINGVSKEAYDSTVKYIDDFLNTGGKYGNELVKYVESVYKTVNTDLSDLLEDLEKQRTNAKSKFLQDAINGIIELVNEWSKGEKAVVDIVKDAYAELDRATQQDIVEQIKTVDSGLGEIAQKYLDNAKVITGVEKDKINAFKNTADAMKRASDNYKNAVTSANTDFENTVESMDETSASYIAAQIKRDTAIKNATLDYANALSKLKGTDTEVNNILIKHRDELIKKGIELNETLKQENLNKVSRTYTETLKENSERISDNTELTKANQRALETYISDLGKVKDSYGDINGSINDLIIAKSKELNAQKSDLEIKTEIKDANTKYNETIEKINASNDTAIEKDKKKLNANIQLRDSLLKYVGVSQEASDQVEKLNIEINNLTADQIKNTKANDNELKTYTTEYERFQNLASEAMKQSNTELANSYQAIADAYKKLIEDINKDYAESVKKIEDDLTLKIINAQDTRTAKFYASQMEMVEAMKTAGASVEEINKKLAESQRTFDIATVVEEAYAKINATASASIYEQINLFKFLRDTTVGLTEDEKNKINSIISVLVGQIHDYTNDITKLIGSEYDKQLVNITSKRDADLKSLKDMQKDELAAIDERQKDELSAEGLTQEEKTEITKKYGELKQAIIKKYADAEVAITEASEKDIAELKKKYLTDFTRINKTELNKRIADIENERDTELKSLEEMYNSAVAAAKDNASDLEKVDKAYAAKKAEINKDATAKIIQANLDMVSQITSDISSLSKAFSDLFSGIEEEQKNFIGDLTQGIGGIVSLFDPITGAIVSSIGKAFNSIMDTMKSVTDTIASSLSKLIYGEDMTTAGVQKRLKLTTQIQTLEQQIIGYRQQGEEIIYNQKVDDINKATQEELKALDYVDEFGNDLLDKRRDDKLKEIEKEKQAQLEALGYVDQYGRDLLDKQHQKQLDDIDEREKAELAVLGLLDKTESQNLAESITKKQREINAETSSRRRAILQAELAELTSEKKKADIKQKYEDERAAAEKKYQEEKAIRDQILFDAETQRLAIEMQYQIDKEKRDKIMYENQLALQAAEKDYQDKSKKFIHDKAVAEQKLALAEAEIAKQKAIHDASKEDKAAVEAEYNKVIAAIKALPIPEAQSGMVVMPKRGGTIVKVAEANMAEAIIPLDRLNQVIASINTKSFQTASAVPTDLGDIHLVVNLDDKPILEKIFPATRNRTVKIDARSIVGNI